ncbi:MAG: hypothetical protein JO126_02105 [Alphaproteobacteria bacterium]|nr:hypothetical protein [Alphaproteobacteria bacterium]MBV8548232.1 hypothetical protein [Alphaproteobacteria bacterium]
MAAPQNSSAASATPATGAPVRLTPPVPPQAAKAPPKATAAPQAAKTAAKKRIDVGSMPFWAGLVVSGVWVLIVLAVVARSGPAHTFGGLPLADWAIGISAIISPVAFVWMLVAYLQRAADIQMVAEPLRRQLAMITGESGIAEARIRRFNQVIREQVELLKSVQNMTQGDLATIVDRVRRQREDMEQFERSSVNQVKEIQDIIRRNMQQIENLMDDKFTMMRVLDDRLVQSGDSVSRQTEAVRDQITSLLEEVETCSGRVVDALERANLDSKRLADTSRAQEATLLAAAESASETLNGLSSKIDLSVARFLERAGIAREEAERLAGALDAQTRSLDEFSNTLPVRVSEAEAVIRGVADRLYASEQLAREQAVNLSEKLSYQVDSLQRFMDGFSERLSVVDNGLQQRRDDLDALAGRIGKTTEDFVGSWEKSISNLNNAANDTLTRFTMLNGDSRTNADAIARHLADTTARYEDVSQRLNRLSIESSEQMKAMTTEVTHHLAQFEALREASARAGTDVQDRAAAAVQNLQHVLERLLATREATQGVGENLVKDLYAAVDQNEGLITRINEATQMSVRALAVATESLGRQEGDMAERTRTAEVVLREATTQLQQQAAIAEKGLREQAAGLVDLLTETRGQIGQSEQNIRDFAARAIPPVQEVVRQVEASTSAGLQSMGQYHEGLQGQLERLQHFHARVGSMGEDLTRITGESASQIDQLNARFLAVRAAQEETARQTLQQYADLSDRLQREVTGLDTETARAVEALQGAAIRVGEQTYQLLQNAENSSTKMQMITGNLQSEATQIRTILQKQSDDLAADLQRAEKQFASLGEALQQRTDAAYALLDRVATHYNETTRAAAQDLDQRTQQLEQATGTVQGKVEQLTTALMAQLSLVGNGAQQLDAQATQIATATGKTLQQITALNEKISFTHEAANSNARQTLARLDECNAAFTRQSNTLNEASQSAATLVQKTGGVFAEQTAKLNDSAAQIDQTIRQLSATGVTLSEQTSQIRTQMEQHNSRLTQQLTDSVAQMDAASQKMQQTAATALLGADQAAGRFGSMTETASAKLSTFSKEMETTAARAEQTVSDKLSALSKNVEETTARAEASISSRLDNINSNMETTAARAEQALSTLGASVTQQTSTLSVLGDQVAEQHRTLATASESQRTQLVELFDKLGTAHASASDVAERSITRLDAALHDIQNQLGVLSDKSQSTVGYVRDAGTAFADQAGQLVQNAQQAEQQARTILSVTAALQEQARHLRETVQDESTRAGDVLGGLITKLAASGVELREVTTATEVTLGGLQSGLSGQTQTLNTTMAQIADRQRTLTAALDAQRDVLNGLLNRLSLAQDETASIAERTVARVTDGTQQINRQMDAIGTQAQSTLAQVQAASSGFADEAGKLSMQAQQAEQQTRSIVASAANMQEQARYLRDTLQAESARVADQMTGAVAQIDAATNQLKQQTGAATGALDYTAQQFAGYSQSSIEALQKQASVFAATARDAEERVTIVSDKMRDQLQVIETTGAKSEAQARQLADTAAYATERLVMLRDSLAETDKDARGILEQAWSRVTDARQTLTDELQRVGSLSVQAVEHVAAAADKLLGQSDALRANLAMSESAIEQATGNLRQESAHLPTLLDRNTAGIEQATRMLKDRAAEADAHLVSTADRFIAVTTTARESMIDEMRRITATSGEAEDLLKSFGVVLGQHVTAMQGATATLSDEQKQLVARAEQSIAELASSGERLSALRRDATQTAERLVREFDTLDQRAAVSTQKLAATGEVVAKHIDALSQAGQRAEGQLTGATAQFREQLERIRTGVQSQIDDINRGLTQITTQLERTGSTLRTTTVATVADVERISQRFDQTGKDTILQLTDKTARMRGATEEVAKLLTGFGDQLDVLLDRLSMAGDGIRRHEGDLVGQLETALGHLSVVSSKLEEGRTLAANVSEEASKKLIDVVSTVQREMQNLTNGSQTAAGIIRGIGQIYGEQSQVVSGSVREAHGQVQAMNKTIEEMQQRTDRMRVSLKLQGDELMGSLQQILRQLSVTGDALGDTVDQVLQEQAQAGLQKIS